MHRIYIVCLEAEMAKSRLGLSLPRRFAKPGALLYVVLLVTVPSMDAHVRIYRELNTLLVDISVSTCPKVKVVVPWGKQSLCQKGYRHSGAEWLEALAKESGEQQLSFVGRLNMELWHYESFITWTRSWLKTSSDIIDQGLSLPRYAQARALNTESMLVSDAYKPLRIRVGFYQLLDALRESALYKSK